VIADIPDGATFQSAEYFVRRGQDGWTPCPEGIGSTSPCNGVQLPTLNPSAQMKRIGAKQYYGIAVPTSGDRYASNATVDVRLVTKYAMLGPGCTAQATVIASANNRHDAWVLAPPGKPILGFRTYGIRQAYDRPLDTSWALCDDNRPEDRCRADRRINFGVLDFSDNDGSIGKYFLCQNQTDESEGLMEDQEAVCRVQVFYLP